MKRMFASIIAVLSLSQVAVAHEITPESDYKYAPITQPNNSKTIIAELDRGSVDVYNLLVTEDDMTNGVALITANALPPACLQYRHFYPSVALVGYGLPEPAVDLPMDLPPGMGAVVVSGQPNDCPMVERPIYTTSETEMNILLEKHMDACAEQGVDIDFVDGDLSWYLPHGLTQECLHCTPWACPMDGTLFQPVFVPGYYQVWVWNDRYQWRPTMDYNLSIGTGEEGETCEGLARTADLYQQAVDGELWNLWQCLPAGVSGFETCEMPADGEYPTADTGDTGEYPF